MWARRAPPVRFGFRLSYPTRLVAPCRRGLRCPAARTREEYAVVQAFILVQTEVGKAAAVASAIADITGVVSAEDVTGPTT